MMPVESPTREKLIDVVEKHLQAHQPVKYRLKVRPDAIEQEDDWFYVVVEASDEDAKAYDYYDRLAQAELAIKEQEHLNVLLVPVLPGD